MIRLLGSFKHISPNLNKIYRFERRLSTLHSNFNICKNKNLYQYQYTSTPTAKLPLSIQKRFFGGYLEEYYSTGNAATGFATPLRSMFIYSLILLQTVLVFGALFHTNYYFTGRILPKPEGNTQLCSD